MTNQQSREPLKQLEKICAEIFDRWDKDQRAGKLLIALSGGLPDYRKDVNDIRLALDNYPTLASECDRLRSENERLREALSYFADFDKIKGGTPESSLLKNICNLICVQAPPGEMLSSLNVFCKAVEEARAALSTSESSNGDS